MPPSRAFALPVRKLRADTQRNRLLLLETAREAIAERGVEATMDDIARAQRLAPGTPIQGTLSVA